MLLVLPVCIVLAVAGLVAWRAGAAPPSKDSTLALRQRFFLACSPIPLLALVRLPVLGYLSPRDMPNKWLTLASTSLSAILFFYGIVLTVHAKRAGQPRAGLLMLFGTLLACVPFTLAALVVVAELIMGGWSY
jgi:hypothetical protein